MFDSVWSLIHLEGSAVHSKCINDQTLRSDIFLPKCPTHVRQIWESTLSKSDYLVRHFGLGRTFWSDVRVDIKKKNSTFLTCVGHFGRNVSDLRVWSLIHLECTADPSKCINDQTLRSDTEFCRTSLLKLSDKCPTKLSDKCPTKLSDKCPTKLSDQIVRQMSDQILPGRSESLHSQIVKL
jgi:hypothetical protein